MQLSDAFARLGTHLDVDVGQDSVSLSFTTLSRNLEPALGLLADVVIRPHLAEADFQRVRDLRLSRLRQLSTSASAAADRAFLAGVFGSHRHGHGTLGTTLALQRLVLDEVRQFHTAMFARVRR
jgi:zinc protease